MKNLFLLLLLGPTLVFGQNYGLQINGSAKVTMLGNVWLTIGQPNALGISRTATTGGIISDNEQSRINWMVGTSTGFYVFPFMSPDGDNATVSMGVSASGTGPGSIIVSTYHTTPANLPYPTNSDAWFPDVTNLWDENGIDNSANVADRFWLINFSGYTANPFTNVNIMYDAVGGNTDVGVIPEANLRGEYWNGVTWAPYNPLFGVPDPPNDQVTGISGITFNAPWVLVDKNYPLPVEMLSFTYECGKLMWTTATETNCDYFQIWYSADGKDYSMLGTVDGAGNSNHVINYQYETSLKQGYFKLIQYDYDGRSSSYGPIAGNCKTDQVTIRVYPNPFNQQFYIVCPENSTLQIYDAIGQLIKSESLITFNTIDLSGVANGLYTLNIVGNGYFHSEKIIKNDK